MNVMLLGALVSPHTGLARGRVLERVGGEEVRPQGPLPHALPESGKA